MCWDERGRLWVLESIDYPNQVNDDGRGRDRIVICTDTDETLFSWLCGPNTRTAVTARIPLTLRSPVCLA